MRLRSHSFIAPQTFSCFLIFIFANFHINLFAIERFQKILPCPELQPYVEHYVVQESPMPRVIKVLPQLNIVWGFQYKGHVAWQNGPEKTLLSTAGITGLLHTYRQFEYSPGVGSVLVYFKPHGASAFLPMPAHELQEQSISLYDILPASALQQTEEKITLAVNDELRLSAVESLLKQLLQQKKYDATVMEAYNRICHSGGNVRISELARSVHISQRQLERRFRALIGTSPKQFASVVRFRQALQLAQQSASLTSLSYQTGYADQSHFIREFESYTGVSPKKFFGQFEPQRR